MAQRFWILVFLALVAPSVGTGVGAQDPQVLQLMETAWSRGADAALEDYDALPPADRTADLLVAVADQLLWTGKQPEASRLLARAEREAPMLTEVRFQQGRAALQVADLQSALTAFRAGLEVVERDATLTTDARVSMRARLENRVALLNHGEALLSRNGGYRIPNGELLLFKFDPYINTFPTLVDPASGRVKVLYPSGSGLLEWRAPSGRVIGTVTFEGDPGNDGTLVMRTGNGEVRADGLGIFQEVLRFEVRGTVIEGTLFRPSGTEPTPAVVLTHGAGLSTRFNIATEAIAYASAGVAAFVYDKPGLGRSVGDNWLLLSIEDQAAYVAMAVDRLSNRMDVSEVGVWGFSQGGWVAPIAAARNPDVAFVVIVSGAAVSPQQQNNQAVALRLHAAGLPADQIDDAIQHLNTVWTRVNAGATVADLEDLYAAALGNPWSNQVPRLTFQWELDWWRENEVDPGTSLGTLSVPILALFGENDQAVPPRENVPLLARYLVASTTGDYTVAVLPGASHQMMTDEGYHALYLSEITRWVASRFAEPKLSTPR